MQRKICQKNYSLFVAFTTTALVMLPWAAGAVSVTVPNAARPENIQRQLRMEDQRPALSNKSVISVDEQGGKELKGNISFEVKTVSFEGASQFGVEELKPFYQDKIGKKITLGELNKIAADITAHYRNAGYILTRAVIPPQKINKGAVKIRIVEGFVADVQLRGDVGSSDSVLYQYAEKIKSAKPLDAATLERYLLLMEDLPGVEARAVLQPSPSVPGASQVVVNIKRDVMEGTTLALNNRGTRYLGPVQATAILAGNNLLGNDEMTSLRVTGTPLYTEQLKFVGVHHEMNVGNQGTKLLFDGNYINSRPEFTLEPFKVEGTNYLVSAGVSHPLIRSRQSNWIVNSDFTAQRINLEALDENLYQDNLRVLRAGTSYDFVDSTNAVNRIEANVSKGFGWNTDNGGLDHSRANGNTSFWKGTANVTRIQPVYDRFSLFASADGQIASRGLFAAEEYALGGERFGSAYDPSELSGDSAIAGRLELQYNGVTEQKYLPSYQSYVFYDIGRVWNRGALSSELDEASLASAGVGTRFNFADSMSGGLEYSFPLTRKVAAAGADGQAPRIFFNLQYRY